MYQTLAVFLQIVRQTKANPIEIVYRDSFKGTIITVKLFRTPAKTFQKPNL